MNSTNLIYELALKQYEEIKEIDEDLGKRTFRRMCDDRGFVRWYEQRNKVSLVII